MALDVVGKVSYLVPGVERPVYIASQAGADAALNIAAEFEEREVAIQDARGLNPPASLDAQGFCLQPHSSAVRDLYDLEGCSEQYNAELVPLVLAATGGTEALVFDHTLRSDSREVRGLRSIREPAAVIHNDYTDASAEKRMRELLPDSVATQNPGRRYAIVNVWRSIAGTVFNSPLACCDARTIAPGDLVASERRAVERIGELELVCWNPSHRWFYFPEMSPDEVLLIKTFDSSKDGPARRSVHTAFDNSLAPVDAPPRESLESRLMVFFQDT